MSDPAVPAVESTGIQPPTVAEVDDWTLTSNSVNQPNKQQLIERAGGNDNKPDEEAPEPAVSAEAGAEAETGAPKRKQTAAERKAEIQAQIAAETRAYHDARRAREAEQAEIDKLRAEREQLTTKPKSEEGEGKPKPTTGDAFPTWKEWEDQDKGTFDEFLAARDEVLLKRSEQIQQKRQEEEQAYRANQAEAEKHLSRIEKAKTDFPDFDEKVAANLGNVQSSPFVDMVVQHHDKGAELLYHFANNPTEARAAAALVPSRALADAIMLSDIPIELVSYFAQNPAECKRLSKVHPATALVALGELKAQLKGANNGSPSPVPTVSNARPPIRPVAGTHKAAVKSPADLDFGPEYVEAMNKAEWEAKKRRYS